MSYTPCPDCGFALSSLDRDCPRCKARAERQQVQRKEAQEQAEQTQSSPPPSPDSTQPSGQDDLGPNAPRAYQIVSSHPSAWSVILLVLGVIIFLVNGSLLTSHPVIDDTMISVNQMRGQEREISGLTGGVFDENSHADLIEKANSLDFRLHIRQAFYMSFGVGLAAPYFYLLQRRKKIAVAPQLLQASGTMSGVVPRPKVALISTMWSLTAVHYAISALAHVNPLLVFGTFIVLGIPSTIMGIMLACSVSKRP